MKIKEQYDKPTVEIIKMELESTIMTGSSTFDLDEAEEGYNGPAYSKRNTFWE